METLSEIGETPTVHPLPADTLGEIDIPRGKPTEKNPLGRIGFDRSGLAEYQRKPWKDKKEYLLEQWRTLEYVLLGKATSTALGVTKKDFGRLMQIVTTAGIAHDKLFPKADYLQGNSLVLNLFAGLPKGKLLEAVGSTPIPRGQAVGDTPEVLDITPSNVSETP